MVVSDATINEEILLLRRWIESRVHFGPTVVKREDENRNFLFVLDLESLSRTHRDCSLGFFQ